MEQALGSLLKHNLATVEVLKTGGRPLEVWRAKGATKATEATKGSESPVTNGTGTAI
jgi:hypothetical protein